MMSIGVDKQLVIFKMEKKSHTTPWPDIKLPGRKQDGSPDEFTRHL